jgi:hypothetical protein
MLHDAYTMTGFTGEKSLIGNAVLESFLLHARILLEFLYQSHDYEDGVTARDYVPEWTKERRFTKETIRFFEQTRLALNARASHLSKKRLVVTTADEKWDTARIVSEIDAAVARFKHLQAGSNSMP